MPMANGAEKIGVIVVDIQGDFTKFKNGSLGVDGTDEAYVKAVEENTRKLKAAGFPIFATQDWHPANHVSFYTRPPHCVQNTPGAEVLLDKSLFKFIVRKGMNPQYESYSGFQDDGGQETEMDDLLKKDKIETLIVYGISTTYCVKFTIVDALALGYRVNLITNLSRRLPSDPATQKAIAEMKAKGVIIIEDLDLGKIK
jgi:nicotinamidase/pyrazinamidase